MTTFIEPKQIERITGKPCPECDCVDHLLLIADWPGGHYAKVSCGACGRFIKWQGKPKEQKAKRPSAQKKLVKRYSRGFCEICLRTESQIPRPQTLEAHHIIPVEQGGDDERENVQICCTACHRLIHWQRTYTGHMLPEEEAA